MGKKVECMQFEFYVLKARDLILIKSTQNFPLRSDHIVGFMKTHQIVVAKWFYEVHALRWPKRRAIDMHRFSDSEEGTAWDCNFYSCYLSYYLHWPWIWKLQSYSYRLGFSITWTFTWDCNQKVLVKILFGDQKAENCFSISMFKSTTISKATLQRDSHHHTAKWCRWLGQQLCKQRKRVSLE